MHRNIKEIPVLGKEGDNIFSNYRFIVPNYQRNYSWGYPEIERMIDDILSSNGKYFLGNLIVRKKDSHNDIYYIIDGQQRLTTLLIILKFLEFSGIPKDALTFQARKKSDYTMENLLKISEETIETDNYSKEIINGFSHVRNIMKQREKLYPENDLKNVLKNTIFFLIEVPDQMNLNHYFEIMNTRSQQLEPKDIIKAFLIGKLQEEDQVLFSRIWNACERMDSYIQMSLTPGDTHLRSKVFNTDWDKINFNNFNDLKEILYNHLNGELIEQRKVNFWEILNENPVSISEKTKKANAEILEEDEINAHFSPIITFPLFLIHVLTIFTQRESSEDNDAMLDDTVMIERFKNCFSSDNCQEEIKNFIISLLKAKFYLDNYIIRRKESKTENNDGEWLLKKLQKSGDDYGFIKSFPENNPENLMIQSCMRITYTSPKSMHWITKLLSANNENDTVVLLENYIREKLPSKEKFETWSGYTYPHLCFTYLDFLLWRNLGRKGNDKNFRFQYRTSIEHFYPQNPNEHDGYLPLDTTTLNSFGNLALISISGNSRLSNYIPEVKMGKFPQIIKQSLKLEDLYEKIKEYKNMDELTEGINLHYNEMLKILYP